jgi:ABC-type nitrate/sulfonate/bicarbonate transport system substrate-binding protein
MATSSYLGGNGDVARRFSAAMAEAADYAEAHPDQTKAAIAKHVGLGANVVSKMTLPTFTSELKPSDVVLQARHEQELGWLEKAPTAEEIFWQGGGA